MRKQAPNAKIVLGGHSSGGGFALRYAGNPDLEPVDANLLLAPFLGRNAPTVRPGSGGWVQVATKRYVGLAMLNAWNIRQLDHLPGLYFNRPPEWQGPLQVDIYSARLNESLQLPFSIFAPCN
jgi:alpha-beta hydrolase superfamily lysophospholipase